MSLIDEIVEDTAPWLVFAAVLNLCAGQGLTLNPKPPVKLTPEEFAEKHRLAVIEGKARANDRIFQWNSIRDLFGLKPLPYIK